MSYNEFLIHCSRAYRTDPVAGLAEFFVLVQAGILGNTTLFPDPPATKAESDAIYTAFVSTRATYIAGGTAQEPAYNTAHVNMFALLDKEANFVDGIAKGNAQTIISSGFKPTNGITLQKNTTNFPSQPTGVGFVADTPTGEIHTFCDVQDKNTSYLCIICEGGPLAAGITFNKSGQVKIPPCLITIYQSINHQRQKEFTGLTPGVTYYIYFITINTAGASPISLPTIVLCR